MVHFKSLAAFLLLSFPSLGNAAEVVQVFAPAVDTFDEMGKPLGKKPAAEILHKQSPGLNRLGLLEIETEAGAIFINPLAAKLDKPVAAMDKVCSPTTHSNQQVFMGTNGVGPKC